MVDISCHLECAVCYGVLVDPVVGACGHDFCLACLSTWCEEQTSKFGKVPSCPLCRTPVGDAENLVVCLRLKNLTEQLFPEKVAARRQELQLAAAQRSQASKPGTVSRLGSQLRAGGHARSRYLRARRSMQLPSPARLPQDTRPASVLQAAESEQQQQQQIMQAILMSNSATAAAAAAAAFAAAAAAMSNLRSEEQNRQGSSWVAPQVNFTMGWWERCDNRRGSRHARSRLERAAQLQRM